MNAVQAPVVEVKGSCCYCNQPVLSIEQRVKSKHGYLHQQCSVALLETRRVAGSPSSVDEFKDKRAAALATDDDAAAVVDSELPVGEVGRDGCEAKDHNGTLTEIAELAAQADSLLARAVEFIPAIDVEEQVGKQEQEGASNKAKHVELVKQMHQGLTRTKSLDQNQMGQTHALTLTIPTDMDPINSPLKRTKSLPTSTLKGICVVCDESVLSTHQRTKSSLGYCHYDCTQKVIKGDAPISPRLLSTNWFMGHPPELGVDSPTSPTVPLDNQAVQTARKANFLAFVESANGLRNQRSEQENDEAVTASLAEEPNLEAKGAQQRIEAGFGAVDATDLEAAELTLITETSAESVAQQLVSPRQPTKVTPDVGLRKDSSNASLDSLRELAEYRAAIHVQEDRWLPNWWEVCEQANLAENHIDKAQNSLQRVGMAEFLEEAATREVCEMVRSWGSVSQARLHTGLGRQLHEIRSAMAAIQSLRPGLSSRPVGATETNEVNE